MKKTLLNLLLAAIIVTSLSGMNSTNAKEKDFFTTNGGIVLSEKEYNHLVEIGFTEKEIPELSEETLTSMLNLKVKSIEKTVQTIKNYTAKDDKSKKKTITSVEGEEKLSTDDTIIENDNQSEEMLLTTMTSSQIDVLDYCVYFDNENICYLEDSSLRLIANIVILNDMEIFIKVTAEWLKLPDTRSYDLIGFSYPENTSLVGGQYGGMQTYTEDYNGVTLQSDTIEYKYDNLNYWSYSEDGLALRQNLINSGNCSCGQYDWTMTLTHSIWGKVEYGENDPYRSTNANDFKFRGSYRHAFINLSILNTSFSMGIGGLSVSGALSVNYDNNSIYVDMDKDVVNSSAFYEVNPSASGFVNRNDLNISSVCHDKFAQLGFMFHEINYFTQSDLDYYCSFEIVDSISTSKDSSSYKELILTVSKLENGKYFAKANLTWKKYPVNRDWDIIGIDLPNDYTLHYKHGRQIVSFSSNPTYSDPLTEMTVYNYSNTLNSYYSINNSGVALKHNLSNSAEGMYITLGVLYSLENTQYTNDVSAHFTHMVDYYNIQNTDFYISPNVTGIQFINTSRYNDYDGNYGTNPITIK